MSRIGKLPVTIPDKVQATIADGAIRIAGPKGELTQPFLDGVEIAVEDQQIVVRCAKPDDRIARSRHGLMRTLLANMVTGVTKGFERVLEIHGVGFRAELEGQDLVLSLGFPEPKRFPLPAGVECKVENQTRVAISGISKQMVGQVAASIRKMRPPEPYQGKGIRYVDEQIKRKVGKSGAA